MRARHALAAAGAINGNTGNLNLLVYGAVQVANALDAVRSQFGPTAGALSGLVPSLAYLQNRTVDWLAPVGLWPATGLVAAGVALAGAEMEVEVVAEVA